MIVRVRRLEREQRDDDRDRDELHLPPDEDDEERGCDCAPADRRQPQERQRREDDDAEDAAEDVEPVRLERGEADERLSDAVPDSGHHCGGQRERNGCDERDSSDRTWIHRSGLTLRLVPK